MKSCSVCNSKSVHIHVREDNHCRIECALCGRHTCYRENLETALNIWGSQVTDKISDLERQLDKYKSHSERISALPSCNDCLIQGRCLIRAKPGEIVRINCAMHISDLGKKI